MMVKDFSSLSVPIDRAMTLIGKLGDVIPHLDETKFNQRHRIVLADGRQFRSPGFDIAQRLAQAYCDIEIGRPALSVVDLP
jgi:hypothetical protein